MKRCEWKSCDKQAEFAVARDKEDDDYRLLCGEHLADTQGFEGADYQLVGELCPECDEVVHPVGEHRWDCSYEEECEKENKADVAYEEKKGR